MSCYIDRHRCHRPDSNCLQGGNNPRNPYHTSKIFSQKNWGPLSPSQLGNCLFGKVPMTVLGSKRSKHSGFGSLRQLLCERRLLKAFSLSSGIYLSEKNFASCTDYQPHVIDYYVRSGYAQSNPMESPDIGIMYPLLPQQPLHQAP